MKIMIARTVLYFGEQIMTAKMACNFVKSQLGFIISISNLKRLLKSHGLLIGDIKTSLQRQDLQPIYDDILMQLGNK